MAIRQWAIADTAQSFTIDSSLMSQLENLLESLLPYLCCQGLLLYSFFKYLSIIFSSSKLFLGIVLLLLDYKKSCRRFGHILKGHSTPVRLDYTCFIGCQINCRKLEFFRLANIFEHFQR